MEHDRVMQRVHPRTLLIVGLVASTLLAACGDDSSSGAAPTADDLDGRAFVATDIEGHTIVDGSEVIVAFEDGRISIQAGCNTQNSGYEINDGVLQVDLLVATMMACEQPLMDQDQVVASIVTAAPTIELDGDDLTISSSDATMSLTART
jgi:heat shock protein HslJ